MLRGFCTTLERRDKGCCGWIHMSGCKWIFFEAASHAVGGGGGYRLFERHKITVFQCKCPTSGGSEMQKCPIFKCYPSVCVGVVGRTVILVTTKDRQLGLTCKVALNMLTAWNALTGPFFWLQEAWPSQALGSMNSVFIVTRHGTQGILF